MRKKEHNIVVKIIFGIMTVLILFAIAYFYIIGVQNKVAKLRRKEQERMRREQEIQNMQSMASIQSVQPQNLQPTTQKNDNQNNMEKPSEEKLFVTKSTDNTSVNVRESPSKNSKIVKNLPDGVNVKFLKREGNWYLVSYEDGKVGYIHKSQLTR